MERPVNPCGWLAAVALLCAAAGASDPLPSGAMAEYRVHCDPWSPIDSASACAALVDRLEAAEDPAWSFSGADKCFVKIDPKYDGQKYTCWRKTPRPSSCNLAAIHTHPYFTKADLGKKCGSQIVTEELAKEFNGDMKFGQNDLIYSLANDVDGYLGVPNRSCVKGWRLASGGGLTDVVWARQGKECTPYDHDKDWE